MSRGNNIASISTIKHADYPNLTWVEIETADGLRGLGETFFMSDAVVSYIHETVAPFLIGRDSAAITALWHALFRQWGRSGIGAEARGASAIDIALWDLFGKRTGLRLCDLLGGHVRDQIPAYNTCGGPDYARPPALPRDRLDGRVSDGSEFEDLHGFLHEPIALAKSLIGMGFTAMKIWPFDAIADEAGGEYISPAQIRRGIRGIELIREAVGDDIAIALEMHGKWRLTPAIEIARAVEQFHPVWIEDPIRMDSFEALAAFTRSTVVPTMAGETLGSRFPFRRMLETTGVRYVMADPGWVGGISETRRVAELAAAHDIPFTPHDCTGPVNLAVGVHLCLHLDNAFMQEMVRAYYFGWYRDVADGLPTFDQGWLQPTSAPGHGVTLRPDLLGGPGVTIKRAA